MYSLLICQARALYTYTYVCVSASRPQRRFSLPVSRSTVWRGILHHIIPDTRRTITYLYVHYLYYIRFSEATAQKLTCVINVRRCLFSFHSKDHSTENNVVQAPKKKVFFDRKHGRSDGHNSCRTLQYIYSTSTIIIYTHFCLLKY